MVARSHVQRHHIPQNFAQKLAYYADLWIKVKFTFSTENICKIIKIEILNFEQILKIDNAILPNLLRNILNFGITKFFFQ